DMIEVGMPYSDPIADGPIIQQSNMQALQNGITLRLMFEQLAALKEQLHVPVILMGYFNPVLQFGMDAFCMQAAAAGVSALIIPDLPLSEYNSLYRKIIEKYGLSFIFLISPATSKKRMQQADKASTGFLYAVSSTATTGNTAVPVNFEYFSRLKTTNFNNPVMIGFGISNKASFKNACAFADGAIIGSAYISALKSASNLITTTHEFVDNIIH
ncbi:MAG: tryptophan synthase subunit alpha, partial [Ferruginibacter sp.]